MNERYQYIINNEDAELPIKELLKRRMGLSSRLLTRLKREGRVYLNGKNIKLFEKGKTGDRITVIFPEESSDFLPQPIPLNIIYEDRDLLVLNKQPGLVVHPTKGHPCDTIANGVMYYMNNKNDSYKIRFINRLDMNTSGVVLIGKNSYCQDDFTRQATEGKVEKRYVAIVKGTIPEDKGTINLPIGKPSEDTIKRTILYNGYTSVTHYEVLERFDKGYTMISVLLETGRTHQIRVHMSHIGYPIIGDMLYGGEAPDLICRQALHAEQLSFYHPADGVRLSLKAPLPEDMVHLISYLR